MSDTTYTLKITDRQSSYYGQVGRWKDKDEDGLILIRFPGGDSNWFMAHEFVDTDGTIYTKSATGKKWHIQHNKAWTLCCQLCTYWCFWFTSANNTPDGEICQQCQQIDEAIRTGEGVPF